MLSARTRKHHAKVHGPGVGDYMVERQDGKVACFTGKRAYKMAYDYADKLVNAAKGKAAAEVYRFAGWEHVATVGDWDEHCKKFV